MASRTPRQPNRRKADSPQSAQTPKSRPEQGQESAARTEAEFRADLAAFEQLQQQTRKRRRAIRVGVGAGAALVAAAAVAGVLMIGGGPTDSPRPAVAPEQTAANRAALSGNGEASSKQVWPRTIVSSRAVSLMKEKHTVRGTARLLQRADGTQLVELKDFSLTRWRDDLFVFVAKGDKVRKPVGIRLGNLPNGDRGTRTYKVPSDKILSKPFTVMVWCDGAKMPIAVSDLNG